MTLSVVMLGGPMHARIVALEHPAPVAFAMPSSTPWRVDDPPTALAPERGRYELRQYAMIGRSPAAVGITTHSEAVPPGGAIRVDWRVGTLPGEEWRAEEHFGVVVLVLAFTGRLELGGSSAEVKIAQSVPVFGA